MAARPVDGVVSSFFRKIPQPVLFPSSFFSPTGFYYVGFSETDGETCFTVTITFILHRTIETVAISHSFYIIMQNHATCVYSDFHFSAFLPGTTVTTHQDFIVSINFHQ